MYMLCSGKTTASDAAEAQALVKAGMAGAHQLRQVGYNAGELRPGMYIYIYIYIEREREIQILLVSGCKRPLNP